jgi:hypothetical protein
MPSPRILYESGTLVIDDKLIGRNPISKRPRQDENTEPPTRKQPLTPAERAQRYRQLKVQPQLAQSKKALTSTERSLRHRQMKEKEKQDRCIAAQAASIAAKDELYALPTLQNLI